MKATCKSYDSDVQMGEKIFDPFEINDIDSNIIDYQGDIGCEFYWSILNSKYNTVFNIIISCIMEYVDY